MLLLLLVFVLVDIIGPPGRSPVASVVLTGHSTWEPYVWRQIHIVSAVRRVASHMQIVTATMQVSAIHKLQETKPTAYEEV